MRTRHVDADAGGSLGTTTNAMAIATRVNTTLETIAETQAAHDTTTGEIRRRATNGATRGTIDTMIDGIRRRATNAATRGTNDVIRHRATNAATRGTIDGIRRRATNAATRGTIDGIRRRATNAATRGTSDVIRHRATNAATRGTSDVIRHRATNAATRGTSDVIRHRATNAATRGTSDVIRRRATNAATRGTNDVIRHQATNAATRRTNDVIRSRATNAATRRTSDVIRRGTTSAGIHHRETSGATLETSAGIRRRATNVIRHRATSAGTRGTRNARIAPTPIPRMPIGRGNTGQSIERQRMSGQAVRGRARRTTTSTTTSPGRGRRGVDDKTAIGDDVVCVDVETTGLDPDRDRVISFGAVVITAGTITAAMERLIYPGAEALKRMSTEAAAVHGLDENALADADTFEEAWTDINAWIETHASAHPPVAHNAEFDYAMLKAEWTRAKITHRWTDQDLWIDTWARSRAEADARSTRHGLDALSKRLGVKGRGTGNTHEAGADAMLLARCWLAWKKPETGDLFEQAVTTEEMGPLARVRTIAQHEHIEAHAQQWRQWWDDTFGQRTKAS